MARIVEMPEDQCPSCGEKFDRATNIASGKDPVPGDFTICVYCGEVNKFGPDLKVVTTSDEEISRLPEDYQLALRKAQFHVALSILGKRDI